MDRWHHSFPARQARVRPLACFSLAFLLGLAIARRWTPPLIWCAAGLAAALLAAFALMRLRRRAGAVLLLCGLLLGMGRMTLALHAVPGVETRFSVPMTGRVISEPFTNPDTGRVISQFRLETLENEPSELRLRLYLRGDDEASLARIAIGQRLELTGHIWANDPVTNPYEFDFGAYLERDGMSGIATAKIEDVTILGQARGLSVWLASVRRAIAARIDALFPGNAPMVRALVLGDRSLISEEMRQSLNATGTAHLIAISGLHVTVLAFALAWLLGWLMPKPAANLASVPLLMLYGLLIGFRPSFLRALVMFAVLSGAPVLGLPTDDVTRLCTALLVCLMVRPLDIGDAGLVLSFSASAGILLLMPSLQSLIGVVPNQRRDREAVMRRRLSRRIRLYLVDLLCASLAAQLATLPAVTAWFGVQSVISLPFNLICVPLCMAGHLLSIVALLLSVPFVAPGMLAARLPDAMFALLADITRFSGRLPVTTVRIGRYPALLVALHWGLLIASSELSALRKGIRRFLPLGLAVVACLSSLLVWARAWPFSVTFLDAGQADCAVIRTRGHTYVFDTGDTYTPAADYLSATCLKLDGVILSHPHQDHAGGLSDILDCFTPGAIYVPVGWFEPKDTSPAVIEGVQRAMDLGVPIIELRAGSTVPLSADCEMTVWSPDAGLRPETVNDMSLLTLITRGDRSVLITGDLTMEGEPDDVPDCEVLKVAHHGSDNATSTHFLADATPEIAVISVGENSFGHPGDFAIERIEDAGAQILRTDRLGAITLHPVGDGWHIKSFLEAPDDLE